MAQYLLHHHVLKENGILSNVEGGGRTQTWIYFDSKGKFWLIQKGTFIPLKAIDRTEVLLSDENNTATQ